MTDAARSLVDRIIHIYPSTVGIIGPDYELGQRLVAAITQAIAEARRAALEEAIQLTEQHYRPTDGVDTYLFGWNDCLAYLKDRLRTAAGKETLSDVDPE